MLMPRWIRLPGTFGNGTFNFHVAAVICIQLRSSLQFTVSSMFPPKGGEEANMKRRNSLAVLAVILATLLLGGCDMVWKLVWRVAGDWALTLQWDGSPENHATWYLDKDHGFTDSNGNGGTWTESGNNFVLTYSVTPVAIFTGTVSGDMDSMSGTMSAGGQGGTWSAVRTIAWSWSKAIEEEGASPDVVPEGPRMEH